MVCPIKFLTLISLRCFLLGSCEVKRPETRSLNLFVRFIFSLLLFLLTVLFIVIRVVAAILLVMVKLTKTFLQELQKYPYFQIWQVNMLKMQKSQQSLSACYNVIAQLILTTLTPIVLDSLLRRVCKLSVTNSFLVMQ